jgi:hypothetical protein
MKEKSGSAVLRNTRRLPVERGNSAGLNPSVPAGLRRDHLNKVVSSAAFARAEQLRRLLAWLGGRSIESNPVPPSEREIGKTVLRRKDFDTQTDSVVRKEMSRLREKLRLYYSTEGARDRVRIHYEGGYLLRFAWSEPFARESTPVASLDGLLDPLSLCLDAESARRVAEFHVAPLVQERMDVLAERANEGLLAEDERAEYEAIVNAADLISILKLKVRRNLRSDVG